MVGNALNNMHVTSKIESALEVEAVSPINNRCKLTPMSQFNTEKSV